MNGQEPPSEVRVTPLGTVVTIVLVLALLGLGVYLIAPGWFGGFTPLIAPAVVARTGHIYAGLWYPISVALLTFVIGSLFLRESNDVKIWEEVEEAAPQG